jgi:peptidoglycan/xylan/chitin deacetylase (PgdA/CDA1 family)
MRARTLAAVAAVGAAAWWSAPAPAPFSPWLADVLGIRRRLAGGRGIALTFDDGPHPSGTPAVLDELARAGARATFFLVGEQVERRPRLAAEIAAAGHEIGVHGYRHQLLLRRTPRAIELDIDRAAALIEDAAGTSANCYRPPYGVFSMSALAHCRRRGWEPLLWSRWGRDWGAGETPEAIARRATRNLCAGDVVLLHDADHYSAPGSWRRTVAALPSVLDAALGLGEPLVSATQST